MAISDYIGKMPFFVDYTEMKRFFTGEELAKAHLYHLTGDAYDEALSKMKRKHWVHDTSFWPMLFRRIFKPYKLFYIRFRDNNGIILEAENEHDACIQAVPFLLDLNELRHGGHRHEPHYMNSCDKCRESFNELADRLNRADVRWLGWAEPDWNTIIHT